MNIIINSSEINWMMKTISQCIDPRDSKNRANIEIGSLGNSLYIHSSNGSVIATMTTPMLGLEYEKFCVDGQMFGKVCATCNGDISISTDGKTCTIKGTGRTRIPLVDATLPKHMDMDKIMKIKVRAEDLIRCYGHVAYAVSSENARIQLTGILTESSSGRLTMTALDGFQMSIESADCSGDDAKMIIPANFLKLIAQATIPGEDIELITDGGKVVAKTDSTTLTSGLLTGDYPDVQRILPKEFATECMVNVDELKNALKSGSVINSKQNLVKLEITDKSVKVTNNSEEADFEAEISSEMHGPALKIAFNQKYLMNTINAIDNGFAVMNFNSSTAPCIVKEKDGSGVRLVLPVRVME